MKTDNKRMMPTGAALLRSARDEFGEASEDLCQSCGMAAEDGCEPYCRGCWRYWNEDAPALSEWGD